MTRANETEDRNESLSFPDDASPDQSASPASEIIEELSIDVVETDDPGDTSISPTSEIIEERSIDVLESEDESSENEAEDDEPHENPLPDTSSHISDHSKHRSSTIIPKQSYYPPEAKKDITASDTVSFGTPKNSGATEKVDLDNARNQPSERRVLKIFCYNCMQKLDVTYLKPFSRFHCPTCNIELIVPKWFDNYLLEEPGGVGGMATVYRALDIALDREVAIKILNPELAKTPQSSELFLNEARTAATINHYAVVPIYTCGVHHGKPYIIMQFMGGGSLETQLKTARGFLTVYNVVRWIHSVAEGLDNAYQHGIIHHDIKPGNILLDTEGDAKIGDFGIAQIIKDSNAEQIFEITKSWISPHYVSPEKVKTGKEDYRGDIYSLGATFYHLITGFTPFNHTDIDELIRLRLTHDPIPPHVHRPELDPALSHLIMSMLDKDPARRPSYKDIIGALGAYIKTEDTQRAIVLRTKKAEKHLILAKESRSPGGKPSPPKKGFTASKGLMASLLLLALLIGFLFLAWPEGWRQVAAFILPNAKPAHEITDFNPEVSGALAMGSPLTAIEFAEPIINSASRSKEKQAQASLQLAFSYYLCNYQDAPERCTSLYNKMEIINSSASQRGSNIEHLLEEKNPPQIIIKYLSSEADDNDLSILSLELNSPEYKAASRFARLIRSLYRSGITADSKQYYKRFTEQFNKLPTESWLYMSWKRRIPFWEQVMGGKGIKSDLEPLFANHISSEMPWMFHGDDPSPEPADIRVAAIDFTDTPENSGPAPALLPKTEKIVVPDDFKVTAKGIQENTENISATRPKPLSPAAVNLEEISRHLSNISAEKRASEAMRAGILLELKEYLTKTMSKIPYETESFSTISANFGPGVLMANVDQVSYRDDKGSRHRFAWSQIPLEEFMRMIHHYASIREKALKNFGTNVPPEDRKVLAWDYLRLAVLAEWYEHDTEAAEAAKKAISIYPDISADVYKLLFQ